MHARIELQGGTFAILDLGSRNGTVCDDKAVSARTPAALGDGARIEFGKATSMIFSYVDACEEHSLLDLYAASMRDGMTGLFNRRHFDAALEREIRSARISFQPLSLAMIDVDHFKRINDEYGHAAGDRVLRTVAAALNATMRNTDVVARYGGEEFAVVLRNTPLDQARVALLRFAAAIATRATEFRGQRLCVTASAGVASVEEDPQLTAEALLRLADCRLYKAKHIGRNRVVAAS